MPPAGLQAAKAGLAARNEMTVSDEQVTQRRQELLAAAARVFEQHGYAATTIDAIAAAANVSKGSVYNYFPSKDALFEAVFEHAAETFHSEVRQRIAGQLSATQKIERILEYWSEGLVSIQSLGRLTLEFWATAARERLGPIAEALERSFMDHRTLLEGIIREGVDSGEFAVQFAPAVGASLIMAVLDGTLLQQFFDMRVATDAEILAALKKAVFAGLSVPDPDAKLTCETRQGHSHGQ